ncbi:nucleotidyltransferase domain containing protein [Theileria equi strain WA]|uniref:Nucleotidyltransferase domain containing protein n=1 Tax=Theileria equi strain WA TaxID=1537102 RepID=L0AVW7_THEEQ|nr:nucleotidyltransferase domain containing protein [Theileria equi strain WA]AFZ79176.1 nucleotidyltransferase domain containing protein [Theileria equi strain WA]|eukprot:XP_004828842.1 nucleotidyltransferase domain containing protein [Theileria equi strain WA]
MKYTDHDSWLSPSDNTEAASTSLTDEKSTDINKLYLQYGAELYSMVDSEEQREVAERNSQMRAKVKSFGKKKTDRASKIARPDVFIGLNNSSTSTSQSKKNLKDYKSIKDILGLESLHTHLKNSKLPFTVILDIELLKLLDWLAPSKEERIAKEQVLMQLEIVVNALFPNAKMRAFGSYATGLSLPGGDIDVFIECEGPELCILNMLVYALNRLGLVHSFECIYNTNVPVVKLVDKRTGVRLDISVFQESSNTTTKFIKEKCSAFKYMQPLILLIKLFLQARNLGDTYFGGVGSYLLYCMVLSFLQMHDSSHKEESDDSNSIATLFVDFFYYWGFIRDYDQFCTTVRGHGHVYPRNLRNDDLNFMFSCESPMDPNIDIGKNAHNMHSVRLAFQHAFMVLKNYSSEIDGGHSHSRNALGNKTIIESLFDVSHPVFQHRKKENSKMIFKEYFYDSFPTSKESLDLVFSELRKSLDRNTTHTFNAQKQFINLLSQKHDGQIGKDVDIPFYIVAEAVANEQKQR